MDNEQFWKLLEPIHARAAAFCIKLTGDYDNGRDLYQNGLLLALRRFDTLRDTTAFRPWLFRILINGYKNRRRSPWHKRREPLTSDMIESLITVDPRPDINLRRWLKRLLETLSPEDQALVVLFEIEGWTIAELAEMSGRPEGTIKIRLARARAKMRKKLKRYLAKPLSQSTFDEAVYALQRSQAMDK